MVSDCVGGDARRELELARRATRRGRRRRLRRRQSRAGSPDKETGAPLMLENVDPVALVTALTALVTAIGGAVAVAIRAARADKRTDDALEKVARAAARSSSSVADVVDELENTGSFHRPTPRDGNGTG
jgi:hypothetical protein